MKVVSRFLTLVVINCVFFQQALTLQLILTTREPHCIYVNPVRSGAKITLNYVVTGVNEEATSFEAKQGDEALIEEKNVKDTAHEIRARSKKQISMCWTKLDRKSKKVNFLVQQESQALEEKASADTVEGVIEKIDALQIKLDQISMNIVSQSEVEKSHLALTQSTTSSQSWMSFTKMFTIVAVCAAQVYMTTSFFSKGGAGRRTSTNDINPFERRAI